MTNWNHILHASSSSEIHLIGITKRFVTGRQKRLAALDNASLWIRRGETMSVVGPTGCGKSTLLRVIAGLEYPDAGTVTFDGEGVDILTPSQRGIGLVFQNYALYPHFKVRGNIAFYFRLRRWAEEAIEDKVQETSRVMGIGFDKLLGRLPRHLSGGEKQRVALARCLSHNLRVLLLDEPFSNLDAALRLQTRQEVKRLVQRFGLTTVFVTHDQNEAVAMGHRIAVMNHGQIEQVGTYQGLYREPINLFVAGFLGSPPMNFFPARREGDTLELEVTDARVPMPIPAHVLNQLAPGAPLTIGIRPEHLQVVHNTASAGLACTVEMADTSMADATQVVYLRHRRTALCAKLPLQQSTQSGEIVRIQFPTDQLYCFGPDGRRL
ncbi:Oligosaccharides import ATP-binding protein MsmX [Candidatus Entotheonellaceae bacterium PAL068K]